MKTENLSTSYRRRGRHMIRKAEKGFTLVELLVVVAIMAILIAVAVGNFGGLIGTGTTESKAFEKEAVQTAVDSYMAVNKYTNITARGSAAVVAAADGDADFKTYLRSLPTTYTYSWTTAGVVTQP